MWEFSNILNAVHYTLVHSKKNILITIVLFIFHCPNIPILPVKFFLIIICFWNQRALKPAVDSVNGIFKKIPMLL